MRRPMKITSLFVVALGLAAAVGLAPAATAQGFPCENLFRLDRAVLDCDPPDSDAPLLEPEPPLDPIQLRLIQYAKVAMQHRLTGLASYYSRSLNGTLTANGERYWSKK